MVYTIMIQPIHQYDPTKIANVFWNFTDGMWFGIYNQVDTICYKLGPSLRIAKYAKLGRIYYR